MHFRNAHKRTVLNTFFFYFLTKTIDFMRKIVQNIYEWLT